MKRKLSVLMIVSLLLVFGGTMTYAQTKEEQEKKKQEMLMKEKMAEQERKLFEEQERIKIHKEELERAVEGAREAYKGVRAAGEPFMITTGSDLMGGVYFRGGSQSSSSLQFSKKVREASFTKDLTFEIEEDARRASISVGGMCEEGEIRIWIAMPDNKPYTEVLIDEYGSVNWSKSFDIEEENGGKTGKWGFRIRAKNATGNFRLSIQSH